MDHMTVDTCDSMTLVMHDAGSSGGSGSLVAARLAPGAFCSDTGGSCRVPGAHTGTVGWRPTLGCYNAAGGIVPMTTSRDTVGTPCKFPNIEEDCAQTVLSVANRKRLYM